MSIASFRPIQKEPAQFSSSAPHDVRLCVAEKAATTALQAIMSAIISRDNIVV